MKINRLSEILNLLDISCAQLCISTNIDEGDLYKLLGSSENYDRRIIEKISGFIGIPPGLLILPSGNNQKDEDLLLLPIFTSFNKPFYIFKLFALTEINDRPLQNFLSFIPDGFSCSFSVIEKYINFKNIVVNHNFIVESEISLDRSSLDDYNIDLEKGSIIVITIEMY